MDRFMFNNLYRLLNFSMVYLHLLILFLPKHFVNRISPRGVDIHNNNAIFVLLYDVFSPLLSEQMF